MDNNKFLLSENNDTKLDKEFSERDYFGFWDQVSKKYVKWDKIYDKVYSGDENIPEWYKGGKLNVCYNVLDIHAHDQIRKHQDAIIHLYPGGNGCNKITYFELWKKVCIFSKALKHLGIKKGDGVLIYMSNTIECVIAMLSCARIGATHSVLYTGFSASNVAPKVDFFKPKLLIASNCSINKDLGISYYSNFLSNLLELSNHKIEIIIIHNRHFNDLKEENNKMKFLPNSYDLDELLNRLEFKENPYTEYEIVESEHPISLVFTSGTTGKPKAMIIQSGQFLSLMNYNMRCIGKVNEGNVYLSTIEMGWTVMQNEGVYGCLAVGATSIVTEYRSLSAIEFYEIIQTYKVNINFITPTDVKLIKNEDPNGEIALKYDLSSLRSSRLGGERLDPSIAEYLMKITCKPIYDEYGQTESTFAFISNVDYGFKYKSIGKPIPGYNVVILTESGEIAKPGEIGELVVKYPLPPSFIIPISQDGTIEVNSSKNKYPGYYRTYDLSYKDEDGFIYILSRCDDVAKVGCIRTYYGLAEEIVLKHPMILDCVVVGVNDESYGERLIAFVLLKQQNNDIHNLKQIHKEINQNLNDQYVCFYTLKFLIPVSILPKNKSGKKLIHILKYIFNNDPYTTPSSISNIDHLKQIEFEINQFKSNVTDQNFNIIQP